MIPRVELARAEVPGTDEFLRLVQRGQEFSIMLGANELMNSRTSGSEEALAERAIAAMLERPKPRVLIGGLGMGFTLRAALKRLPADAEVTVAELVPEVIDWARGPMAHIFEGSLDDPRVRVEADDVAASIAMNGWDAILLDVDNGPDALARQENYGLYSRDGLARAKAALRGGGVLALWSAGPDERFTGRLKRAGFEVEELVERARGGLRGARHVIWLGIKR
jgi:spermidine synthase